MPYIDKEKFRMHIIMKQHNPLKVILTDKEKEKFTRMLDEVPTADVIERKRGKWIINDIPGTGWYRVTCSECGEDVTSVIPVIGFFPNAKPIWNFCPDCGSDNREESDNGRFDEDR